jgi:hypothetical protein
VIAEKPASPPKPVPANAPWITYLGLASEKGVTRYYFKDSRSTRIIALSEAKEEGEWALESKDDSGFVLRQDGALYRVSVAQR